MAIEPVRAPRPNQQSTQRRTSPRPSSAHRKLGRRGTEGYGSTKFVNELRIATQNISGPSLARVDRLLSFFAELDADVLVLTETRPMPGTEFLLDMFRRSGYGVVSTSPRSRSERGVALVHRFSETTTVPSGNIDLSHRVAVARAGAESGLTLVGAYVPSRDTTQTKIARKQLFLAQLSDFLHALGKPRELILVGDLNVIHRDHVPRYAVFRAWEYDFLDRLGEYGLVDIFTRLHPGIQAYSWIGRTGDGYRYDYVFVGEALAPRVLECEYLNQPREEGISDHAGVLMTLRARSEIRDVRLRVGRQASLIG